MLGGADDVGEEQRGEMRFTSLIVVLWRFEQSMRCASPRADAAS